MRRVGRSVVQRGGSIDFDIAAECWLLHEEQEGIIVLNPPDTLLVPVRVLAELLGLKYFAPSSTA